jgi:DNA-binding IclR family transcriptional regulator
VDRDALREVLAATRRGGYSTSIQQYDMAQSGVAAPVFDKRGQVVRIGGMVSACAERITARTGGRRPPA